MSISGLDPNAPASNGLAGLGDDEIRALKTALQVCFPNLEGLIEKGVGSGVGPTAAEFSALFDTDATGAVPVGLIAMWGGDVTALPDGWALCNGSQGTPDLRQRFIVGAGGGESPRFEVGNSGGDSWSGTGNAAKLTTATGGDGSFNASITIPDHVLTVDNLPEHRHYMYAAVAANNAGGPSGPTDNASTLTPNNSPSATGYGGADDRMYVIDSDSSTDATVGRTSLTGGAGTPDALTHNADDITIDGIEHTHEYVPQFYALAYIQYIG